MASLVESGKYRAVNTTDGFYFIVFKSGTYALQGNTTIEGQIITAGELVVKEKYICSMQVDTNWYWDQQQKMSSQCQHAQYFIHNLKLMQ